MTPAAAKKKISELRAEVARHDELYYRKARPELSDFEYDQLQRSLADLEARFPQFASAASPTQRVGDDRVQGFQEVAHRQKMLSLDNTYNEAELRGFHTRLVKLIETDEVGYTVEPKIDGLAVSLTYEEGRLVRAVTRGKGDRGDDITANVLTISSLPRELAGAAPRVVEIRGEIYLTQAEFERINAERAAEGRSFTPTRAIPRRARSSSSTPRKSPAGSSRLCSTAWATASRPSCVPRPSCRRSCAPGVCPWSRCWTVRGIDEAWAAIGELDRMRRSFAYGTDGAVVKLDDFERQRSAGATDKSPRWASCVQIQA
jgi:DNA ligase (NAD+)